MAQEQFQQARVTVAEGMLQGSVEDDLKVFRGIPYAAPPTGELRFRKPEPPARWKGVRAATQFGGMSIQFSITDFKPEIKKDGSRSHRSEDCLYLNIWSPAKSEADNLPVFIWLHGGGMVSGAGSDTLYDGARLAQKTGMIVVTINYRLGFFGFFCHPELTAETEEHFCGNYALLDMRQAVLWIRENIRAFGGNPENLTLAGQSGGAVGCGAILASPLMEGLYQHIIIESGPAFWGMMQAPAREILEEEGVKFVRLLEKDGVVPGIKELRKMDAWELYELAGRNHFSFNYCVDGYFLPERIQDRMEQGRFNQVDVMMGSCAQEFSAGLAGSGESAEGIPLKAYKAYLEKIFTSPQKMEEWYPASTPQEAEKAVFSIGGDLHFMGSVKIGQLCRKYGRKAYIFRFRKGIENELGQRIGAPHSSELPYLFGREHTGGKMPWDSYEWKQSDYCFSDQMMHYWYEFCKKGDPNGEGLPEWKKYEQNYDVFDLMEHAHMIEPEEWEKFDYFLSLLEQDLYGTMAKYLYP